MQNNALNAVIFDLDGVVIDTKAPIEAFWNKWAHQKGIALDKQTMHEKIHGRPAKSTLNTIFGFLSPEEKEEIKRAGDLMERGLQYIPMPGVIDFLNALVAHQIKTALVTSSLPEKVETVFQQLGLSGLFNEVVTADLITHGKPAPECYLFAAGKLKIPAQTCIVFEDSASGVRAAHKAGMQVIGINEPIIAPMLINAGAATVIPDFTQIKIHKKNSTTSTLFLVNSYEYSLNPIR